MSAQRILFPHDIPYLVGWTTRGRDMGGTFRSQTETARRRNEVVGQHLWGLLALTGQQTFAGHVARLQDDGIVSRICRSRGVEPWRTRQARTEHSGRRGRKLRHRGRGVLSCAWGRNPQKASDT